MRKSITIITIIALLLCINISSSLANVVETMDTDASIKNTLNERIEDIVNQGKAKGAITSLVIDGEAVGVKGYGYADQLENMKADGYTTGFRIGSVSKTFVAVAALIAMEEGVLDIHKDISAYLEDDFPKLKYPVTMHNLLTHTAGFEETISGMVVENVSDTEPLSLAVKKYIPEQILNPGDLASYSNYGIGLAAYVIERATGMDFADYCREKIFLPLGMKRTTFLHMQDTVYVSKAYLPNGEETMDVFINLYPEGSAVSTAEDMSKYIQWLLKDEEDILRRENKAKLFERQHYMADELGGIGYVWNRKSRNGSEYFEKKGETLHFYSRILLYPEKKAGLFLSFNTYVPEEEINRTTAIMTDQLLGEKVKPIQEAGANIEIEGLYVNAWSSFRTEEKLLRFLYPGKTMKISGSVSKGFTINSERITHLGNNAYDTPIGTVKFFEKGGKTIMATDFSQSYIRVNTLENKLVILTITLLFALSTITFIVISIIGALRKKLRFTMFTLMSIVQMVSLVALVWMILIGIMEYNLLAYKFYIHLGAWVITVTALVNFTFTIIKDFSNTKGLLKYAYYHNVVSFAFCLVLVYLNLLI
ncbi:serine hydrolase domain-containing protein [Alkaliphilus serpentinus]|nr:serine hydrolase domain-containing protein [Alkaliphilus serpentinus]